MLHAMFVFHIFLIMFFSTCRGRVEGDLNMYCLRNPYNMFQLFDLISDVNGSQVQLIWS